MMNTARSFLIMLCLLCLTACRTKASNKDDALLMKRVFAYAATMDTMKFAPNELYSYMKFDIKTRRRNAILMAVPSMLVVARGGKREYVGESYAKMVFRSMNDMDVTNILSRSTIPHSRKIMPTMLKYLIPDIYGELLIDKNILSPFYRRNRRYYRYRVRDNGDGTAHISFRPKLDNTRLIKGTATIDVAAGRIMSMFVEGEYDMVKFTMDINMGERGVRTLIPEKCGLSARFKFLGNDISVDYTSMHGLPRLITDSVVNKNDTALLNRIRPVELTPHERRLFHEQDSLKAAIAADTTAREKKQKFTDILWDNVGEHLLRRIKSNFGSNNQGSVRINPLLNPLYFGYSGNKGFVYKFDVRGSYYFSSNSLISTRLKAGYSFKQKRLYFDLPVTYYFNRRRNGYVQFKIGNGNRISNSRVLEAVKGLVGDSAASKMKNMSYFNDFNLRLSGHYDLSEKLSLQAEMMIHRRSALNEKAFMSLGMPSTYTSVAPMLEMEYRPLGFGGPVLTANYERSIKGLLGANLDYERYEIDGQYIWNISALQSLQMRAGTGFYTHRGKDRFFLDYTNFHENNLPGGWYDDWACDFELLNSNWYNSSQYYVRTNLTYESPLMILAWIPLAGHFIEKERIYVNALTVKDLHPYMEYGYGFTTRLFSTGIFVSQKNGKFDGIGFRFGVELFRQW